MAQNPKLPDPEEWESLVDHLLPGDARGAGESRTTPPIVVVYGGKEAAAAPVEQGAAVERSAPWTRILVGTSFAIALVLGVWASAPCPSLTPDSVQYLSAARNIVSGHGLVTSATPLEIGLPRIPFSAWPPLYPMLLAAGSSLGTLPWARALNLLAFLLTLIPLYTLARTLLGPRIAPLLVLGYSAFRPALMTVSFVWSETLFTLWALTAMACLVTGVERSRRQTESGADDGLPWILTAGLFAALAALTRYAGLAAIGAGCMVLALRTETTSARRVLQRLALFVVPATVPVALWCTRNQILTGHLFGDERAPASSSQQVVILDTLRTLATDWIFPPVVPEGPARVAVWIAAGLLSLFLALVFAQRFGPQVMESHAERHTAGITVCTYAIFYLGLTVVSTLRIHTDPINTRLLLPAYPAFLLLLGMVVRGTAEGAPRGLRFAIFAASGVLFLLNVGTAVRFAGAPRETRGMTAPYWRSVTWAEPSYHPPEAAALALVPEDHIVISNVWDRIALHFPHPVKPLPGRDEDGWPGAVLQHAGAFILVDSSVRPERRGVRDVEAIGPLPPGVVPIGAWEQVRLYYVRGQLSDYPPLLSPSR